MLEFKKLCDSCEKLTAFERGVLTAEKSAIISARLHLLDIPDFDPLKALAGFIIGSVMADGRINEQEYLLIYPALVKAFGDTSDLAAVKDSLRIGGRNALAKYTEDLLHALTLLDSDIKRDVIMLCLCVASIDGKISLKERKYISRLCRA